ncbi:MAG TPA: VOC family protein [Parvularculaceae bacterium]|nr:VOC family protein [Amphiplicatus sp.]MCB9956568.1 VOC family protein [Caulobacterales bacterium]HPE29640.1 VOC family protein [Parvularculaceae bacterium]HRX38412.1 VOC family protein [Parvularculaceae bacterium]
MTGFKRNSLTSALCYRNPKAALDWLEKAYGFEPAMIISDANGDIAHSEMRFGECLIMIGNEWTEDHKSPASIEGKNTQTVHVHLEEDIDAHCERARKAGAEILMEPETQFYGDRTYRARDPEGHIWTFGQMVKQVSPEEWDRESGFSTKMYE